MADPKNFVKNDKLDAAYAALDDLIEEHTAHNTEQGVIQRFIHDTKNTEKLLSIIMDIVTARKI